MSPSAPQYAGPPPRCPPTLVDKAPLLTEEMLKVPTSELYAASLAAAWEELGQSSSDFSRRPSPERIEELEPHPQREDRPTPRHYGPYALQRAALDWSYHVVPSKERQALQDSIVNLVLTQRVRECSEAGDDEPCRVSDAAEAEPNGSMAAIRGVEVDDLNKQRDDGQKEPPLALFTAGGMGAGKGHTLRELLKTRRIRLAANTVWIDPDALSRLLPERPQYVASNPATASALLHPEASLLQEICAAVAREEGRSLVVDGSLTDCAWFEGHIETYREAGYDCEILFVSSPEDVMLRRAGNRAKATGRVTNPEAIKRSRLRSPKCVAALSKPGLVRRVRLYDNSSDSSSTPCTGPELLYDSDLDPDWPSESAGPHLSEPESDPSEQERRKKRDVWQGGWVDASGFVEGRLMQGQDGRVREKEKKPDEAGNGCAES